MHRLSALGFVSARQEVDETNRYASHFAIDVKRMNSNVGTLSGGNQQKVALGKWLGINPRVLLVEEPTRGVDIGARADIYAQLRRLSDSG
ncbi:ribose import ATP-binding protein RbsA [Arthrobacter sp. Hiyo6]|nr:ribose import ATP-binding protein RbsA [Arthrobacter sp. Hiyo6]